MIKEWALGDKVILQKAHPCGSYEWEVYRVGADIGIRCTRCGHRLLIARRGLEKRARKLTQGTNVPD